MTISELMTQLSKVVEQFGDVDVFQYNQEYGEFNILDKLYLCKNEVTEKVEGVTLSFNNNEVKSVGYSNQSILS